MFRKLEGIHKVSAIKLSKASEAEIDSCFKLKVEFYNPQNEYNLRKTFVGLENLYKEKLKKKKIVVENSGNGKGEYMKRDNLILLDDVTGLADRSHSFVKLFDNVQKIWIHCIIHISWACIKQSRTFYLRRKCFAFFLRYGSSSKSSHEIYNEDS